ncbi:hypothetical protein ABZ297_00685 [Nonomuraea sp. NPDC005983]|uniref:hypothetical protein n=1 Tax=Nonomuraea sp. NPDC005983 TaxID=3155595 RepID=UPI0033A51D40
MTVIGRVVAATAIVATSVALAGPAWAADTSGQITSPSDGEVVSTGSVQISARTGIVQLDMGLYVEGPSTAKQKIAGGGANQTLSGTFDAGNAPNGTFTVTLKGELTSSTYDTRSFKLRRPASPPSGVSAALRGAEKVEVTWSKGAEPDLQSYEVSTSQSGIVGRMPVDSACSGSSCKAVLAVPARAAGQRVGFTVKAFRGDGDGGSIESGSSGAVYVTVPAPPTATPKKTPADTPRTPKKGVETLPTLKRRTQPTVTPTHKRETITKLPAMPDTDPKGNLPIPTAGPTTDGVSPEGAKEQVTSQASASPLGDVGQYGVYIAGGLLLLLLAAHAGAWARRRSLAAASGGPAPVSAPAAAQRGDDSVPPTATAPRRPAVVLAVARTRPKAEQPEAGPERPRHLGQDAGHAPKEPVRIALPSSAVTVLAEPSVTPPAVRIEDRWDDYLPPSPRAMEDSGFWERPLPGEAEFWAADDEESAVAGRLHRGGDS